MANPYQSYRRERCDLVTPEVVARWNAKKWLAIVSTVIGLVLLVGELLFVGYYLTESVKPLSLATLQLVTGFVWLAGLGFIFIGCVNWASAKGHNAFWALPAALFAPLGLLILVFLSDRSGQ